MHNLTLEYRLNESDLWKADFEKVLQVAIDEKPHQGPLTTEEQIDLSDRLNDRVRLIY